MKTTMNITATSEDMDRFSDRDCLRHFYKDKGIDGIELMLCGEKQLPEKVTPEDVVGLHLSYYASWYDFWKGNRQELVDEYGEQAVWEQYYGGSTPEVMLEKWTQELDFAQKAGVRYVVFHVAECRLDECVTYQFKHTDREICDAALEIINKLLDGKDYTFDFLVENLWWSGMNLLDPEVTEEFLQGIHYVHKGIMLDTGHLLHTNNDLRTQEEGVEYIHSILDRLGKTCRFIRGVHFHQTLSGEYVQSVIANPFELPVPYWDRLMKIYPHIFQIDRHKPFTADGAADLLRRMAPEYLTFELITTGYEDHNQALNQQLEALRRNGGMK